MNQLERRLWGLALLTAATDIATTMYGLSIGLQESNPLIAPLLGGSPLFALVAVKGSAILLAVGLRTILPKGEVAVPAGLLVVWGPVTLLNLLSIAIA